MRQINLIKTIIILISFSHIIISCNVKEKRDVCPCLLSIDLSQCINKRENKTLDLKINGAHISETINIELQSIKKEIIKKVPKEVLFITAISNKLKNSEIKNEMVIIPEGCPGDSIFYHANYINAQNEKTYERINLKQGYVKLFIETKYKSSQIFPFEIEICSNTNGFNLISGKPSFGDFRYVPTSDINNNFQCIIPRQGDNSLVINIYEIPTKSNKALMRSTSGKTYRKNKEKIIKKIELGKILERQNYDWNAVEPKDIHISIDLNMPKISISINDWELEINNNITI